MVSKSCGYVFLLILTALLVLRITLPSPKYSGLNKRQDKKVLKTDTHLEKDHPKRFNKSSSENEKMDFGVKQSNSVVIYQEKKGNILIRIDFGGSNERSLKIDRRRLKLNVSHVEPKKSYPESNSLGIIKNDGSGLEKEFLMMQFNSYLVQFNKSYTGKEYRKRFRNFKKSLSEISTLNEVGDALYGLTQFSDMSKKEFAKTMLLKKATNDFDNSCDGYMYCSSSVESSINRTYYYNDPPKKVDWRKKGVIGPIVYQHSCGGCWAISIVGVMESMAAIAKLNPPRLSIQEVLDCIPYNRGCYGGSIFKALDYMCETKLTVVSEADYPLKFINEACRPHSDKGFRLASFRRRCAIPETTDLLNIIANHGPVVALVNAFSWQYYMRRVIHFNCEGKYVNHAVQIVGYDLTAPIPYYIVRNSWGVDFGDHGYVYVAIGNNVCVIASDVFYFDVKKNP